MTRDELDAMSKDELYELATDADVSGRSAMSKGELVDALADDPAPDGDGRTPGIDPKLVEARDALREREAAEAEAVEDRTGPIALDPELERIRAQTIEADAASESDVRNAPGVQ